MSWGGGSVNGYKALPKKCHGGSVNECKALP